MASSATPSPDDTKSSVVDAIAEAKAAQSHADTHEALRETGPDRGREAEWPSQIPALGWKDIAWRLWDGFNQNRVLLVAAGATFYLLLALFPALGAFVSIYGFVSDPRTVADHVAYLAGFLPQGGIDLIKSQLQALASQDTKALGFGFLFGLCVALWSANNGIKALFDAMNIAYAETEKRSFLMVNAVSLLFTLGALTIAIGMLLAVGVVPAILAFLHLDRWTTLLVEASRWPILLLAIVTGISLIYRFGPSRETAKWRWLSWGAVIASLVWIAASAGFSFYLQNFADYNATYGSLGAVVGLMTWTWISVIILILGAAINAEMEHQTEKDSTTGRPKPMGERGAVMADTLGKAAD